jgi:uncharacterized delta-60 repeat protein
MMKKMINFQVEYFPIRIFLVVFLFVILGLNANAQPGANDPTFNPTDVGFGFGDGADYVIYTTAIQSDGKIIIGGVFSSYNGTSRNEIARINSDGTLDTTFNPGAGVNNSVYTTAIQSDGKIIIGGAFGSYNGIPRNRIARLNIDGTLDATFNLAAGVSDNVHTIAIQSDGKIIINGNFTSNNGIPIFRIARLNIDGTLDTTFNSGTGANYGIYTTAIQSDGKIIIGGNFTSYNGTSKNRIARLNIDGTLDSTFNPGTGANYGIYTTAIQSDGKIIIGGDFTSYNGTSKNRIARLNIDGTLDATFNPGTGANGGINKTVIQSDGKIIIVGEFTSYNATTRNRIARLNADGTLDASFNPGTGANVNINTTLIQSDGKIIIGGNFTNYNGTTRNKIARLNIDGTLDALFNLGSGANNYVLTTAIQSDGKIIIGGAFTTYNGTSKNHIARLNIDGTLDASFNFGTGANDNVQTIAMQSDGKIIIGGAFTSYNGITRRAIARLNVDGTLDATFNHGAGADNNVNTIAIQSDGKIIIGGGFTSYNGTTKERLVRLNTDGTLDTTFNTGIGVNGDVYTTAIQSDGKIIISGSFSFYNGIPINNIARLNADGTLDATFSPGSGVNNQIFTMAIQSDGKIIIGGAFSSYNGIQRNRIVRLNNDGTLDATFISVVGVSSNSLSSIVNTTAIQSDGKIVIGGTFNSCNGTSRNGIARLNIDGTLDVSFDSNIGADDEVSTTAIQSDGKIIIGGNFTSYNGVGRNRVARIRVLNCNHSFSSTTETTCDSYLAPDGQVYTTSGVKTAIIPNTAGCDSIITINLTIKSTTSSITETACDGYTAPDGQVYTTSGIKTAVIPNAAGCDSTITINLSINPVDVSSTINGTVITANASGAIYQWVNCDNNNSPISGATNQSYSATANGSYAVIVAQGSCSDTSACQQITTVGMNSVQPKAEISIYPNPVSTELTIDSEGCKGEKTFELINSIGQVVIKGSFVGKTTVQTSDLAPGVYLIKLGDDQAFGFKKIVKE